MGVREGQGRGARGGRGLGGRRRVGVRKEKCYQPNRPIFYLRVACSHTNYLTPGWAGSIAVEILYCDGQWVFVSDATDVESMSPAG